MSPQLLCACGAHALSMDYGDTLPRDSRRTHRFRLVCLDACTSEAKQCLAQVSSCIMGTLVAGTGGGSTD